MYVHQTNWLTKSETLAYLFRQARVLCTLASCLWCRRRSSGCNAPILPMRTNSRTCMCITGLKYRQACFLSLVPPPQLRLQRPHSPHEDQLPYLHVHNRVNNIGRRASYPCLHSSGCRNEEITPLLHTGIGERYSKALSNLGHAAPLRRCELPL